MPSSLPPPPSDPNILSGLVGGQVSRTLASASSDTSIKLWNLTTLPSVRQWVQESSAIAENDDIEAGIVTISYIERLLLPEDGLYEIEIRSWDNRSGGSYTLVIESIEIGPTVTPSPSSQEQ